MWKTHVGKRLSGVSRKYEGWHGPEHYPYVAYGHRIRKGEKFPVSLTESEGDSILRKDLKEMCALFRHLGRIRY